MIATRISMHLLAAGQAGAALTLSAAAATGAAATTAAVAAAAAAAAVAAAAQQLAPVVRAFSSNSFNSQADDLEWSGYSVGIERVRRR
jgi:hypothetical protein